MIKRTKRFLLVGSLIWVVSVITISIYIYPQKREGINLTKQELLDLTRKPNKSHEENIAILDEYRTKGTLNQDTYKAQKILKEVKTSLAFSIIQYQIEYNENKKDSLYFIFYGMGALLVIWGFLLLTPNKSN